MESEIGKRHPSIPDAELLRRIAHDMRCLYADVIKQPLPRNIENALSRIEREQSHAAYQGQRFRAWGLV